MKLDKFNKFVLPHEPSSFKRTSPYIVVCEGLADAGFISALLVHKRISDYQVGCPSKEIGGGQGKDRIPHYLEAIAADTRNLKGIIVVVDTDGNSAKIFKAMAKGLGNAGFAAPTKPFDIHLGPPKSAVFLMPRKGKKGALEHILLEAAFSVKPKAKKCVDQFVRCVGGRWKNDNLAKMKAAALTASHCRTNPACSLAYVWAQTGNPFPISSKSFDHITKFLTDFVK